MWGKPVFTICSTLFAQIGYKGILVYNLFAGIISSILIYEMLRRKTQLAWRSIFGLTVGTLVIVGSGYLYFGELSWFIKDLPIGTPAIDVYGNGNFFRFIIMYKLLIGIPLGISFLFGIVFYLISLYQHRSDKQYISYVFLVGGMIFVFVFGHSYAWWKGTSGSLGLLRVMGAIVPLVVIVAMQCWIYIRRILPAKMGILILIAEFTFIAWHITYGLGKSDVPSSLSPEQAVIKDAYRYIAENDLKNRKIYYNNVFILNVMEGNPFEPEDIIHLSPGLEYLDNIVKEGEIIFWDSHFSANEGKLILDSMLNNKTFDRIKDFQPEYAFITLNGYSYEVILFQRNNKPHNLFIKDSLVFLNNYEESIIDSLTNIQSLSGQYSAKLTPVNKYSGFYKEYKELFTEVLSG